MGIKWDIKVFQNRFCNFSGYSGKRSKEWTLNKHRKPILILQLSSFVYTFMNHSPY